MLLLETTYNDLGINHFLGSTNGATKEIKKKKKKKIRKHTAIHTSRDSEHLKEDYFY
jgi:hypothetical protein